MFNSFKTFTLPKYCSIVTHTSHINTNFNFDGSDTDNTVTFVYDNVVPTIAVTSDKRLPGVDVPTLKEQGIDVVIGNWRGVYAPPGITPEQRKALTELVLKSLKTKSWTEALEKNGLVFSGMSPDGILAFPNVYWAAWIDSVISAWDSFRLLPVSREMALAIWSRRARVTWISRSM